MIYKVTAKGTFREVRHALDESFHRLWDIDKISRPNQKGIVIIDIISPVIPDVVEPLIGIELKFAEGDK